MKITFSQIKKSKNTKNLGFSLTEIVSTVVIIGALSAISIPSYVKQISRGCQSQAESIVSQAMMQTQTYNDEFGTPPKNWDELDKVATLMTKQGPATGSTFGRIELQACDYDLWAHRSGNQYLFEATQKSAVPLPEPQDLTAPENTKQLITHCPQWTG